MKNFLILLLLIPFVFSCKKTLENAIDNNYFFSEPQPINDTELIRIPAKFLGKFMSKDSVYYNIVENGIYRTYNYKFKIEKTTLDSLKNEFEITDKKFISKNIDKSFDYRFLKDSIELSENTIDTIFVFSENHKAKRIDNQLILNFKDSTFWKVKVIAIQKNKLQIRQFVDLADLKKLDSITTIKPKMIDSIRILLNPSRKEFKKIINLKIIGEEVIYTKILSQ